MFISRIAQILALFLALGAAAAQSSDLTAPGEMVDVGGHSLHMYCIGEGSPTVLFEAGLGDGSTYFRSLQLRTAQFTRACIYDRAGYGFSQPGPLPRDMAAIVSELETMLAVSGEPGPYVLAGHSYGGVIALNFANRNPGLVSGIVLIDSSHPNQLTALQAVPEVVAVQDMEIAGMAELIGAAEAGLLPAEALLPAAPPVLSAPLKRTWAELFVQPGQLRTVSQEYAVIESSLEQAAANVNVGSTPLIVLSRGLGLEAQLPAEALEPLGLTPDVLARFDAVWNALQIDLATLSSNSKRLIAYHGTHHVFYGEPALVEAAIRELVRRAQASPAR